MPYVKPVNRNPMNDPKPKALLTDRTHYILPEDYIYSWEMAASDADKKDEKFKISNKIIVKAGFRWDGASVPKLLWAFGFNPDGLFRGSALVHDFIYIHKGKLPSGSMTSSYQEITNQVQYGSFSRYDADRLFGKMMKEAGVGRLKRWLMTKAVIWFGWLYWQDGFIVFIKLMIKTVIGVLVLFASYKIIFGNIL